MEDEVKRSGEIRQYLLGELPEQALYRLEARMMVEDDFASEIKIVEDELVDEYIAGELSDDERQKFERIFLRTPQGRQQVNFGMALRRYSSERKASISARAALKGDEHHSHITSVAALINTQSRLARISLAAAVLLLFVSGRAFLRIRSLERELDGFRSEQIELKERLNESERQLAAEQNRSSDLERELGPARERLTVLEGENAALRSPKGTGAAGPPGLEIAIVLSPGLERGDGTIKNLVITGRTNQPIVRLNLPQGSRYASYSATLKGISGSQELNPGKLKELLGAGRSRYILLSLPLTLQTGDYRLILSGETTAGPVYVATYNLRVVN
jgi:hypothetical protein